MRVRESGEASHEMFMMTDMANDDDYDVIYDGRANGASSVFVFDNLITEEKSAGRR